MTAWLLGLARSAIATILPPEAVDSVAALALSNPLWATELLASRMIRPPDCVKPLASSVPEFTTLPIKSLPARADKIISPSGARTARRFLTKLWIWLAVTVMLSSFEFEPKFKVTDSPAAIATVPCVATITPPLRTSGASKAI